MDSDSNQFTTPDDTGTVISKQPTPTGGAGASMAPHHRLHGVRHGAQVAHDAFTVSADKAGHRDIAGGH